METKMERLKMKEKSEKKKKKRGWAKATIRACFVSSERLAP